MSHLTLLESGKAKSRAEENALLEIHVTAAGPTVQLNVCVSNSMLKIKRKLHLRGWMVVCSLP